MRLYGIAGGSPTQAGKNSANMPLYNILFQSPRFTRFLFPVAVVQLTESLWINLTEN